MRRKTRKEGKTKMRDVIRALEDYQKLRWTESGTCIFGHRDAEKIRKKIEEDFPFYDDKYLYSAINPMIIDALRAGYAIGYKRGKRVMQAGKD